MKSTGIVRKLDDLGRICLPKELRRSLEISDKDPIEIFTDGDTVMLRKYTPCCVFCGEVTEHTFHGKRVCGKCIDSMTVPFAGE